MSDSLEAALKSVLRDALHEVVADLMNEWRAAAHSPSPLPLPLSESLLLTARETAKRLAISERHLHSLTRSGQLPCVRVGSCVRYNLETVQKWVRESETTDPQASRSDGSAPPSPASIRATRSERKPKRKDSKSRSKVQPVPAVQRTNLPPKPRSNEKAKAQETKTEEWVSPRASANSADFRQNREVRAGVYTLNASFGEKQVGFGVQQALWLYRSVSKG